MDGRVKPGHDRNRDRQESRSCFNGRTRVMSGRNAARRATPRPSFAGWTRESMPMDGRVKPGHDGNRDRRVKPGHDQRSGRR